MREFRSVLPTALVMLFWVSVSASHAQQLAFPGAIVIAVTNLNDSGPGSLRAAVDDTSTRTIVFRVAGTIALQSDLVIKNGNLTIAGQTAPGDGICLRDYPLSIEANNVIIRYLRVRLGDVHRLAEDALSVYFRKDLIIDHCSFSWGTDEVLTVRDNENTTVQWCIISESLNDSYHPKGTHGYGGIWGGKGATFHHNLIAHHTSRTPRLNGSRYHKKPEEELVDFRNNVIYNWGFNNVYGGEGGRFNLVANYYKCGPASRHKDRIAEPWDDRGNWYVADNFVSGYPEVTRDNWAGGIQGEFKANVRVDAPHPCIPVATQSAEEAYELVLSQAGAVLPERDTLDARIVAEVREGRATFGGSYGAGTGIIDSQSQVGGWPTLRSAAAPEDEDGDGMADDWERARGLDATNLEDRNGDLNGDGYTNLENYLNGLVRPQ